MSKRTISIDEALAWFGLNKATVDESNIKSAYRTLAKKYHPDSRGNYKEKLAASENFVAATEAKDMLIEACKKGIIPVATATMPESDNLKAEPSSSNLKDFDLRKYQRKKPPEPTPAKKSYADTLTGRRKYDYHNPRPIERLFDVKYVGGIVATFVCIGAPIAMSSAFLALSPLLMIYPFIKIYINAEKLFDFLSGVPMFFIYYATTYVGILMLADGKETVAIWMIALAWGSISMMVIDEVYSLIRYKIVFKKIKQDLAIMLNDKLPV